MSLTDIKAKNAKPLEKEYKLTDGFGMFLRVTPKGSKYWQMAYRFEGKQKLFSIGVYPAVSLSDARQRRDEARRLLAQGIDPNAKKQAEADLLQAKEEGEVLKKQASEKTEQETEALKALAQGKEEEAVSAIIKALL